MKSPMTAEYRLLLEEVLDFLDRVDTAEASADEDANDLLADLTAVVVRHRARMVDRAL